MHWNALVTGFCCEVKKGRRRLAFSERLWLDEYYLFYHKIFCFTSAPTECLKKSQPREEAGVIFISMMDYKMEK